MLIKTPIRTTAYDYAREDTFDSRDVQQTIDWLEQELDDEESYMPEELSDFRNDLAILNDLKDEAGHPEWGYGVVFIAGSYFEDYARELAEDLGAINRDADWPASHIDWPGAADALKIDFSSVEFQGTEFWYRS